MEKIKEFKLYSVSDKYISYLRKNNKNVYSNKADTRVHTRKYLGVALEINGFAYYIPMSSPKGTDYIYKDSKRVIRKSTVPIIRIVVKNAKNKYELKGTLRISHMIPVPASELALYDVNSEADQNYKKLVQNEIIFIRKNTKKIQANAELIYKQKKANDATAGYIQTALNYGELERLCSEYSDM